MLSLRFSDIKSACSKAVNLCPDDARVLDYVNRAAERLLMDGRWKGTVQTFRFCLNANGCIVWPREIETVEAVSICQHQTPVRSGWFEFQENGFGQIASDSNCLNALLDRGEACTFDDVIGTNKKLAIYADKTEAAGGTVTIQFWDQHGQFVRTQPGLPTNTSWIDGERLSIPTTAGTYVYTTNLARAGAIHSVAKTVTNGVIRLFEYDTTTAALRPLAVYQPDEEVPVYRRSLLPALNVVGDCEQQQVIVRAKLRFVPVRNDEDLLVISHREALRLACRAIFEEENSLFAESTANWGLALRCLQQQLSHHKGAEVLTMRVQSPRTFGGGSLCHVQ